MRTLLLLLLAVVNTAGLWAQSVKINGRVIDFDTGEGIPFADVYVPGTTLGVAADLDGYFSLTLAADKRKDSLAASALGYQLLAKALRPDSVQVINFSLRSAGFDLGEVVVLAGENPANAIVKGIIANKDRHRPEALNALQYESYAKIELDLQNVPPEWQDRKMMEPFSIIFEGIDSTSDEVPFLPVYINEVLSNVFYVQGKPEPREVVRAQRSSGLDNPTIMEWIRQVHAPFNVYDNWLYVLEKPFISPFANAGLFYYEYYILDSAYINGQWCHKLKFKPKRKQENTFYGDFWVADSSFAVQRVQMRMSPDVNINLVRRIIITEEVELEGGHFLPIRRNMIVDFTPTEGAPGIIARRTETRRDFAFDAAGIQDKYQERPTGSLNTLENDETFWADRRHVPLTTQETKIYAMVDSVHRIPLYRTYTQVVETIFNGYFEAGKIALGPYATMVSNNPIEGLRVRLGARTTTKFSENIRLGAHIAYGFRDERFKYGGTLEWILQREPRIMLGGSYRQDISLSSESSEDFLEGDIFSGILRRPIPQKLIFAEEAKLYIERWGIQGISQRLTLLHRTLDPFGGGPGRAFQFSFLPNPENPNAADTIINTTELLIKLRYAFGEKFIDGDFVRTTVGSERPILELQYVAGLPDIAGSDYSYHKLTLQYRHYIDIAPIGWLSYRGEIGKVWGTVPFLLMKVHPGNESWFMARGIFNTMNRYEFASDTYASFILEHHFDGFFLNKIPLLRKLNWREVALFKGVVGSISEANRAANRPNLFDPAITDAYNGFRAPDQGPYLEAGVGIENIFKLLRFDALWRLRYLDNPQASRFRLMAGMYFFF